MAEVLVLGFDPATFTEYDAEPVLAALQQGRERFEGTDLAMTEVLVALDDDALPTMEAALRARPYDVVVVGGGIRKPPELVELFEEVVNLVHRLAPGAAIAFNTSPVDTYDAARRVLGAR